MAAVWDPKEEKSGVYDKTQKHSDRMISFAYRRSSRSDTSRLVERLKKSQVYQDLLKERTVEQPAVEDDHS